MPPRVQHLDVLWVTDAVLAGALERYFVSSHCHVSSRRASNVPGPLESRRRLGKRQMGDLGVASSHPSLPAWAVSNPPDLSRWRWEPPTPAGRRENDPLSQRLPAWLAEWAPPDETVPPPSRSPSASAVDELSLLREAIFNGDSVDHTFKDLCHRLETDLSLGQVSTETLSDAVRDVLGAISARQKDTPGVSDLVVALCSAVVDGIASSRVLAPTDFGSSFWGTLLSATAKLPASQLCDTFELCMATVPPAYHGALSNEILGVLEAVLDAWATRPDEWDPPVVSEGLQTADDASRRCDDLLADAAVSVAAGDVSASELVRRAQQAYREHHDALDRVAGALSLQGRQTRAIAAALSRMDPKRPVLATANRLARSRSSQLPPEAQQRLRYNWLSVLAQCPHIRQRVLVEMAEGPLSGNLPPMASALSAVETCRLLISHWRSRARLTRPQAFEVLFESTCAESAAFAALAYAVSEEGQRRWLVDSLCGFLRAVGRLHELPSSFSELSRAVSVPVRLLERVATAADDYRAAMGLFEVYARTSGSEEKVAYTRSSDSEERNWDPGVWRKYLDAILSDPAVSPARLWRMLGIEFYEDTARWRKRPTRGGRFEACRADLAASLAVRFAYEQADRLGNRAAFRQVSQCVRFLEKGKKRVPPAVLQALYHVVSRDLADGQPGRTARLAWFVRVVERNSEAGVPAECAILLQQWQRLVQRRYGM